MFQHARFFFFWGGGGGGGGVGGSIFGNTFNTTFGVSHRFVTPIKGYRVMDSFVLLAGFEFSVNVYG